MTKLKCRLKGTHVALKSHKTQHPYQLHEKTREVPLTEVQREFLEWVEATIKTEENTSWLHPRHRLTHNPSKSSEAKATNQKQT